MSAVPAVSPLRALLWAPPVLSPSTSWESHTLAAPQLMETPHLGAQPRLMPTMIMSLELVPGGTARPPAPFKVCFKITPEYALDPIFYTETETGSGSGPTTGGSGSGSSTGSGSGYSNHVPSFSHLQSKVWVLRH